jgi:hypothetical protein
MEKIETKFKLQMSFLRRPLTAFLASNLLAQFSRPIVVQILGMASPKVCGNTSTLAAGFMGARSLPSERTPSK